MGSFVRKLSKLPHSAGTLSALGVHERGDRLEEGYSQLPDQLITIHVIMT